MNELQTFCQERKMNKRMEDSFNTYVRSSYSSSYAIRPGDTLSKMISNMTREMVEEMWQRFVVEFKDTITIQV